MRYLCLDPAAGPAGRFDHFIWFYVQICAPSLFSEDICVDYSRCAAHAANFHCLLRARFYIRVPDIARFSGSHYRVCDQLCLLFQRNLPGGNQKLFPAGNIEAGQVLGMTKSQIFFKVILVQVIKRLHPQWRTKLLRWSKIRPWPV